LRDETGQALISLRSVSVLAVMVILRGLAFSAGGPARSVGQVQRADQRPCQSSRHPHAIRARSFQRICGGDVRRRRTANWWRRTRISISCGVSSGAQRDPGQELGQHQVDQTQRHRGSWRVAAGGCAAGQRAWPEFRHPHTQLGSHDVGQHFRRTTGFDYHVDPTAITQSQQPLRRRIPIFGGYVRIARARLRSGGRGRVEATSGLVVCLALSWAVGSEPQYRPGRGAARAVDGLIGARWNQRGRSYERSRRIRRPGRRVWAAAPSTGRCRRGGPPCSGIVPVGWRRTSGLEGVRPG